MNPLPPSSDSDGEVRLCTRDKAGNDAVCSVTGAPFQHPSAGVLHFSSDYTSSRDGVERFSGYRFFDSEVVGMDDGGGFGWTNGVATWKKPGTNKCGLPPAPPAPASDAAQARRPLELDVKQLGGPTSPTHIRAYVWAYIWPKGEERK